MALDRQAVIEALERILDSNLYRALSEPARIQILKVLLLHGPLDISGVVEHLELKLDRSVVSRHLKVLAEADLVCFERQGRQRVYAVSGSATVQRFEQMGQMFRRAIEVCCPEQLEGCCQPRSQED